MSPFQTKWGKKKQAGGAAYVWIIQINHLWIKKKIVRFFCNLSEVSESHHTKSLLTDSLLILIFFSTNFQSEMKAESVFHLGAMYLLDPPPIEKWGMSNYFLTSAFYGTSIFPPQKLFIKNWPHRLFFFFFFKETWLNSNHLILAWIKKQILSF